MTRSHLLQRAKAWIDLSFKASYLQPDGSIDTLSREADIAELAALLADVAREQREVLAQWMIAHSFATGHGDTFADLLKELEWQVVELRKAAAIRAGEPAQPPVTRNFARPIRTSDDSLPSGSQPETSGYSAIEILDELIEMACDCVDLTDGCSCGARASGEELRKAIEKPPAQPAKGEQR